MPHIKESQLILTEHLHPNRWNPNEQSEETFNQLVQEIREDGFDHPLNVIPIESSQYGAGHYWIIGGEHRWRAATLLGLKEVPCYIHTDWDEDQAKIKTVRRNILSGNLNARKFTDLVTELSGSYGLDMDDMPVIFGFQDRKEFDKFVIKEEEKDTKFVDDLKGKPTKVEGAESLMSIVSNIFQEANGAATVDQSYLFFTVKGAIQMAVLCDSDTWVQVENMVAHLKDTGQDATQFMQDAIKAKLKTS